MAFNEIKIYATTVLLQMMLKSITRSLIIFKKQKKITNDFFNHYIFVRRFQWTSSECLTIVTITVKVAMFTYIHCENGYQNVTSEAYLQTCKHLRRSFLWEQFTAEAVNWFHKKLHFRSLSIPSYELAKYLAKLLSPHNTSEYTVKSTSDFITHIKGQNIPNNFKLISFDVAFSQTFH